MEEEYTFNGLMDTYWGSGEKAVRAKLCDPEICQSTAQAVLDNINELQNIDWIAYWSYSMGEWNYTGEEE